MPLFRVWSRSLSCHCFARVFSPVRHFADWLCNRLWPRSQAQRRRDRRPPGLEVLEGRFLPSWTPVVAVADSGGVYNGFAFAATATVAGVQPGIDDTPGLTLEGVGLTVAYYAGSSASGTPLAGAPSDTG